jgi:hypothetical protein
LFDCFDFDFLLLCVQRTDTLLFGRKIRTAQGAGDPSEPPKIEIIQDTEKLMQLLTGNSDATIADSTASRALEELETRYSRHQLENEHREDETVKVQNQLRTEAPNETTRKKTSRGCQVSQ